MAPGFREHGEKQRRSRGGSGPASRISPLGAARRPEAGYGRSGGRGHGHAPADGETIPGRGAGGRRRRRSATAVGATAGWGSQWHSSARL